MPRPIRESRESRPFQGLVLRPGLRSFAVGQYVIVYTIEDEDVKILHVFHGHQDIEGQAWAMKARSSSDRNKSWSTKLGLFC